MIMFDTESEFMVNSSAQMLTIKVIQDRWHFHPLKLVTDTCPNNFEMVNHIMK